MLLLSAAAVCCCLLLLSAVCCLLLPAAACCCCQVFQTQNGQVETRYGTPHNLSSGEAVTNAGGRKQYGSTPVWESTDRLGRTIYVVPNPSEDQSVRQGGGGRRETGAEGGYLAVLCNFTSSQF